MTNVVQPIGAARAACGAVPCIAVVARTDPNERESVVLLPELDAIHPQLADQNARAA